MHFACSVCRRCKNGEGGTVVALENFGHLCTLALTIPLSSAVTCPPQMAAINSRQQRGVYVHQSMSATTPASLCANPRGVFSQRLLVSADSGHQTKKLLFDCDSLDRNATTLVQDNPDWQKQLAGLQRLRCEAYLLRRLHI